MKACASCGAELLTDGDGILQKCAQCGQQMRVDLAVVIAVPDDTRDCPCPKTRCERHGRCLACHLYHHQKRHLPRCLRGRARRCIADCQHGIR